jgi:hypothetical protein
VNGTDPSGLVPVPDDVEEVVVTGRRLYAEDPVVLPVRRNAIEVASGGGDGGGGGGGGAGGDGRETPQDKPGHDYRADNRICSRALTDDEKRKIINKFTVPSIFATSYGARNEEGLYLVTTAFGLPGGFVNTTFFDGGLVGQNVTTPIHGLVGTVQREVVNRADGAYITTHGFGTAPLGLIYIPKFNVLFSIGQFRDRMNDKFGPGIFSAYDKQVARYAQNHFEGC